MGRKTNKNRRQAQAQTAREKAAAARGAQKQAEQRRRAMVIISSVVAVAVVGAVIAFIAVNHKSNSNAPHVTVPASAAVVNAVTNVSDTTLANVGEGNVLTLPAPVPGEPPLTSGGKPELLYIGAEFCPYCAIERWSLAEALSKFGRFSNLGVVRSGPQDGNFASLDFYKSTYSSKHLTFTAVENQDRFRNILQPVTSAQKALWYKLTNNSPGFPFIDFGNKVALTIHPPLDPTVLGSLNQQQVAAQLNNPTSKIAQTVGGGANDDIAGICIMTNNQPARVCSSSVIHTLETKINASPPAA
jgi:hypothetical protein